MDTEGRHREKTAIYKPSGEATEETYSTNILILNFQSPELWEKQISVV